MIQQTLAIWSLVPLPFLNLAWTSGRSWFIYCWSQAWKIFSITLLACEMRAIVQYFKNYLALHFFRIGMKIDHFKSCGQCRVFQLCWKIECSTFTESSFRIWNSLARISSPPLPLFVVMLLKVHLTSQQVCIYINNCFKSNWIKCCNQKLQTGWMDIKTRPIYMLSTGNPLQA